MFWASFYIGGFFSLDLDDKKHKDRNVAFSLTNSQTAEERLMLLYRPIAATGSDILVYRSEVSLTSCSVWGEIACLCDTEDSFRSLPASSMQKCISLYLSL